MKEIEGYDTHKKPQVVISGLIKIYDQGFNGDIKRINEKIQSLCTSKGFSFIDENVDILCVAETKIDKSFPTAQFSWSGYHKPYRLDISDRQGRLLVYIKSHLPSRSLTNYTTPKDIQVIPFELNLRKERWMFLCFYRSPAQNKQYFLENLTMIVDHYSSIYDNHIILEDFNLEPDSPM